MKNIPTVDEAGGIAVKLSEHLTEREQAFFVAGFQEAIKYLWSNQAHAPEPQQKTASAR